MEPRKGETERALGLEEMLLTFSQKILKVLKDLKFRYGRQGRVHKQHYAHRARK